MGVKSDHLRQSHSLALHGPVSGSISATCTCRQPPNCPLHFSTPAPLIPLTTFPTAPHRALWLDCLRLARCVGYECRTTAGGGIRGARAESGSKGHPRASLREVGQPRPESDRMTVDGSSPASSLPTVGLHPLSTLWTFGREIRVCWDEELYSLELGWAAKQKTNNAGLNTQGLILSSKRN